MKLVAKFCIDAKFVITGKGIILTGLINDGEISIGNFIEFSLNGDVIKRKIKGREFSENPHNPETEFNSRNTGLLIECKNKEEIKRIKDSELKGVKTSIFEI